MRAFPGTSYEQYLDTPLEAVEWLRRIHHLAEQEKRAQQEEARGG